MYYTNMLNIGRFRNQFSLILRGSISVFRKHTYQIAATICTLSLFCLYLLVPILLVPGNTLMLELGAMSLLDYVLLFALALMTGILLTLELFSFRYSRAQGLRMVGEGSTGIIASLIGGVLATASCGCGIGILLGVIGLGGGALFVTANQTPIIIILLGIVMIGLYFSARRAAGLCGTCKT